jgi:chemotaxis regulatin CheY-phosphate phosphatase CheZ
MVAAERSQEAAQRLRGLAGIAQAAHELDTIEGAAVDIFMACSFQDLTGQRIRKVVHALAYIEKRVMALTALWQGAIDPAAIDVIALDSRADAHLLDGPSDSGLQQDDIDTLLHDKSAGDPVSQNDIDALSPDSFLRKGPEWLP